MSQSNVAWRSLLVARVFPPKSGGIERYVYELHRCLGVQVTLSVVAPDFPESRAFDAGLDDFTIQRTPFLGPRFKLTYLPLWLATILSVTRRRPDIIVCDQVDTGLIALLCKKAWGIPYLVFVYGAEMYDRGSHRLKRLIYREAERVIACSADTRSRLMEHSDLDGTSIDVVYPGVDIERFAGGEPDVARERYALGTDPVLLTVSRLALNQPYKGVDTVLRAMPLVLARIPEARYLVVGDGDGRDQLEQLARQLGVDGHVIFAGRASDAMLPAAYAASDLFVMPSRETARGMTEGFGIVYLEAASARKPVVYAASGGAAEAAIDGQTGLRVDPLSPESVARAIIQLLENPAECCRLGDNGYRRVREQFTWEGAAAAYQDILIDVLRQVSRRHYPAGTACTSR